MPQIRRQFFRANPRRIDHKNNSVEQNVTTSMAWKPRAHPCAAAFAIFIAITGFTAPLVLDTGWLRGAADSTTPATPQTIRRRATVAVAKRQSIARGAGGFAARRATAACQWFWQMVRAWSPERRAQLLQWTTGHARVPVQGFSHLMGRDGVLRKFTLTSLELSQAVYPRAHTCFNRIDVPLYRTKEELVAGFEFVLELGDQTFTMD